MHFFADTRALFERSVYLSHAASLAGVLALAGVHIAAGYLHRGAPVRPRWLSIASGVSIAYVFVHLMPELAEAQASWLNTHPERPLPWLDQQIYLAALVGVLLSLGADRATAVRSASRRRFWLHLASACLYNLIIGGLAVPLSGVMSIGLGVLAFGAHFLANDHALQREYGAGYRHAGRWLLAAALPAGWLLTVWTGHEGRWVPLLLGLLAGGIIVRTIADELPPEHGGHFKAFATGALAYSALLIALAQLVHRG